jgi:hypothetical protein
MAWLLLHSENYKELIHIIFKKPKEREGKRKEKEKKSKR